MPGDSKASALAQAYRAAGPYLSLGIEFAAAVLLCLFAGHWMDGKLDTSPWLLLVGAFLGAVAGFYNFFRSVIRLQEREQSERKKNAE